MASLKWREFNYLEYRSTPEEPGIYCWRYRPRIEKGHVNKIKDLLACEIDKDKKTSILFESINNQLVNPFRRPEYSAVLRGPLLPSYRGSIAHDLPDFSHRFAHFANNPSELGAFIEYVNDLYDMISTPFYIGIAESQSLRSRISSHVSAISRYKSEGRFSEEGDEESKNLASRIVERNIDPSFLWISCLPISGPGDCSIRLSDLEFVLNRTIYPVLGKN